MLEARGVNSWNGGTLFYVLIVGASIFFLLSADLSLDPGFSHLLTDRKATNIVNLLSLAEEVFIVDLLTWERRFKKVFHVVPCELSHERLKFPRK